MISPMANISSPAIGSAKMGSFRTRSSSNTLVPLLKAKLERPWKTAYRNTSHSTPAELKRNSRREPNHLSAGTKVRYCVDPVDEHRPIITSVELIATGPLSDTWLFERGGI